LIPHQLPLTSTISNQTNLPPTHPLTADVNNDYLESNSSYSNGSIDKNTLKQILIYLRKNTELLVETNKIEVWKSATRKLLKNGYIYPNETGFKDYFISVINEQYDSKKKKRSTTPSNSKSHEKYFAKI
ncbi:15822_t:CDS:2, partial [Entrophospora sp. SA101]